MHVIGFKKTSHIRSKFFAKIWKICQRISLKISKTISAYISLRNIGRNIVGERHRGWLKIALLFFFCTISAKSFGSNVDFCPQIVIVDNAAGDAVAVWEHKSSPNNEINGSSRFSGTWSPPTIISTGLSDSFSPIITATNSGSCVVIWLVSDPGLNILALYGAMLPLNGSWSTPVLISTLTENVFDPRDKKILSHKIVINSSEEVIAIWSAYINDDLVIRSSTATFGGSWTAPVTLN